MSDTRIPREEFLRQLRALAPGLLDRWIAMAETKPDFPEHFEVGETFNLLLQVQVRPMNASDPSRVSCGEPGCSASLEFSDDATAQAVEDTIRRRGWEVFRGALLCPRCLAAAAPAPASN